MLFKWMETGLKVQIKIIKITDTQQEIATASKR